MCSQALGRVIRHKNDWGAVFLLDPRFQGPQKVAQLSKWVRPRVQPFSNAMQSVQLFRRFLTEAMRDPELNAAAKASSHGVRYVYLSVCLSLCVYIQICLYICVYMYICIWISIYVCLSLYMCLCYGSNASSNRASLGRRPSLLALSIPTSPPLLSPPPPRLSRGPSSPRDE